MNKHDLIKAIAATSGLRAVDILKAMGAFENILVDCMARGERLFWSGIGSFSVREHKARSGRSPFTGLKIQIPMQNVKLNHYIAVFERVVLLCKICEQQTSNRIESLAIESGCIRE